MNHAHQSQHLFCGKNIDEFHVGIPTQILCDPRLMVKTVMVLNLCPILEWRCHQVQKIL